MPAVGIDQDLFRIKAQSPLRLERTLHTIAIDLAPLKIRDEDMPVMIGPVFPGIEGNDASRFRIIYVIEQEEFYESAVLRKQAEVDTLRG